MSPERKMYDLYRKDALLNIAFDNTGTDTEQLDERDTNVTVSSALGNGTIYMPPVSKCQGQIFTIRETNGSNNTVIRDFGIGATTVTDCLETLNCTLATAGDVLVVYSTGQMWIPLFVTEGAGSSMTPAPKVTA